LAKESFSEWDGLHVLWPMGFPRQFTKRLNLQLSSSRVTKVWPIQHMLKLVVRQADRRLAQDRLFGLEAAKQGKAGLWFLLHPRAFRSRGKMKTCLCVLR
jgi:hypothetical protein